MVRICALISIFFCLAFSIQALDIVREGRVCAEIIVASDAHPGIRCAAEDLRYFLEKISGSKLDIVPAPTGKFPGCLFVGENTHTKKLGYCSGIFQSSGYEFVIRGNYAIFSGPSTFFPKLRYNPRNRADQKAYRQLMDGEDFGMFCFDGGNLGFNSELGIDGNDDIGPWYAVSAFLEKLGVRFYAPYEDGCVIPVMKTISVPDCQERREAAYPRREWYHGHGRDTEGIRWFKRMKCGVRSGIVHNHTMVNLLKPQENRTRHPNWYAEESPGRTFLGKYSQGGVPRYTDPGFQQACVKWARKLLDTYPELHAITLGAPDGGHPWDWRDRRQYQKKGISELQAYANMYWDFHCAVARELKESHPGKFLIYWSPYNFSIPDAVRSGKIPDNIIFPVRGTTPSEMILSHVYAPRLEQSKAYAVRFHPRAKGPAWEWWLSYVHPWQARYPIFFTKTLQKMRQEFLPYTDGFFMEIPSEYASRGAKKFDEKTCRLGEVAISHLMMYVNNKLMWDPFLDMKALLDEYYRLYFGPAEQEMKQFHEFAEKVWCRPESRSVTENSGFLKECDVAEYFRLLAQAKVKTEPGSVYFRRIDAMEKGYAPLKKLFSSLKRSGPWLRAYPVSAAPEPDGDLVKYQYGWSWLRDNLTSAEVTCNRTEAVVALSTDRNYLRIGVRCYENAMDRIMRRCTLNDVSDIFNDDLVEVYLDTPERSYFKICINPNGAIYDESTDASIINRDTMPVMWNPGTKASVKIHPDRWEVEILIPTTDFGKLGPTKQYPWGINICRTRINSLGVQNQKNYSIAPTGGSYREQKYWARLWMR